MSNSECIGFTPADVQILIPEVQVDVEIDDAVISCVVYDYDSTVELQTHQVEVWSTPEKLVRVQLANNGRRIFSAVVRLLKAHPPRVSFSRGVVDRFSR